MSSLKVCPLDLRVNTSSNPGQERAQGTVMKQTGWIYCHRRRYRQGEDYGAQ